MNDLFLKEVSSKEDAEILRLIRNSCRTFMTRFTNEISYLDQMRWWGSLDKERVKCYLLYQVFHGVAVDVVGYGVIKIENDCVLLSGGLNENSRNKGFGKTLFTILLEKSKEYDIPIRLEVLKKNMRAFSVYNGLGFRVTGDDGRIITMEYVE